MSLSINCPSVTISHRAEDIKVLNRPRSMASLIYQHFIRDGYFRNLNCQLKSISHAGDNYLALPWPMLGDLVAHAPTSIQTLANKRKWSSTPVSASPSAPSSTAMYGYIISELRGGEVLI
eukprot:6207368-Pleurochrysis_carterae.AAC.3